MPLVRLISNDPVGSTHPLRLVKGVIIAPTSKPLRRSAKPFAENQ